MELDMETGNLYLEGTYLSQNPTWHEEDSAWKAVQIMKLLKKYEINPSTVCEVGCGAGEILNCMRNEFPESVQFSGYEISPQAYELCRKKEKTNMKFHFGDLLHQNLPPLDLLMAIDVFEHIEDYFGFLRGLKKTGVYKVFHIPLDLSVQSVLRMSPILNQRTSVGHLHYFTKETALATLRDAGYDIVGHCFTPGSLELPAPGWKTRLAKLPRKLGVLINQDLTVRMLGGFSLLVLAK
jgi:hypothetical protein